MGADDSLAAAVLSALDAALARPPATVAVLRALPLPAARARWPGRASRGGRRPLARGDTVHERRRAAAAGREPAGVDWGSGVRTTSIVRTPLLSSPTGRRAR